MYKTVNEKKKLLFEQLMTIASAIAILLFIGTIVYHFAEGWSYLDSLYFATISLTSRGFSNMMPTHWFTVLFSVFYLLLGVAIVIYGLSSLVAYYTSFYQERVRLMLGRLKKPVKPKWVVMNHSKSKA